LNREKVTVTGVVVVAVPDVKLAFSQVGTPVIWKLTLPIVEVSWYWKDAGENASPWVPEAAILVVGETCSIPADWTKTHAAPILPSDATRLSAGPPTMAVLPSPLS
jgi:hypothetical protein